MVIYNGNEVYLYKSTTVMFCIDFSDNKPKYSIMLDRFSNNNKREFVINNILESIYCKLIAFVKSNIESKFIDSLIEEAKYLSDITKEKKIIVRIKIARGNNGRFIISCKTLADTSNLLNNYPMISREFLFYETESSIVNRINNGKEYL